MGTKINDGLRGKDLITIGIFTAIIFILSLLANILGGIHPLTWLFSPAVAAIFTAIPFMLLATKVQKPFAILITGVIMGLIFLVMGMFPITLPLWLFQENFIAQITAFGLPADYLAAVISYTSPVMLLLMYLLTFICAIVACVITRLIFRKHFERAGIV